MFAQMVPAELLAAIGKERFIRAKDTVDPLVWKRASPALDLTAIEYLNLIQRQQIVARVVEERTREFDGWLTPTVPKLPAPFADLKDVESASAWNLRTTQNTRPGNVFGQCGASIPIQHLGAKTLPVGLQLSMSGGSDERLLTVAVLIEKIIGKGPRPDVSGFIE